MAATPARRLDHIVIGVRNLDDAVARYQGLGFDARLGGRHIGRGTHNAIVRFGLDYLELVSVCDETEARAAGRGDLVDFLAAPKGPIRVRARDVDIAAEEPRLRAEAGAGINGPVPMERMRPDGTRLSWRLVIPGGGADRRPWPFFIQWDQPDAERIARDGATAHPNGARGSKRIAVRVRDHPPRVTPTARARAHACG